MEEVPEVLRELVRVPQHVELVHLLEAEHRLHDDQVAPVHPIRLDYLRPRQSHSPSHSQSPSPSPSGSLRGLERVFIKGSTGRLEGDIGHVRKRVRSLVAVTVKVKVKVTVTVPVMAARLPRQPKGREGGGELSLSRVLAVFPTSSTSLRGDIRVTLSEGRALKG
eukprot:1521695-Pyramimonas_sp.AAC.1